MVEGVIARKGVVVVLRRIAQYMCVLDGGCGFNGSDVCLAFNPWPPHPFLSHVYVELFEYRNHHAQDIQNIHDQT